MGQKKTTMDALRIQTTKELHLDQGRKLIEVTLDQPFDFIRFKNFYAAEMDLIQVLRDNEEVIQSFLRMVEEKRS